MTGWNSETEKLKCLLVLDDTAARQLCDRAGKAYFRAFIVEDRTNGEVRMKFRYRQRDPDETSWFSVRTGKRGAGAVKEFRLGMARVLRLAAEGMGTPISEDAVMGFYPPDDGGNSEKTLDWLLEKGLVEIVGVESTPDANQEPADPRFTD